VAVEINLVHANPHPVSDTKDAPVGFPHQAVRPLVENIKIIPDSLDGDEAFDKVLDQLHKKTVVSDPGDKGVILLAEPFVHKAGHDPLHDVPLGLHGFPLAVR
jgi:hypothetical protein